MDCPRCARSCPDDARFCSHCGAPLSSGVSFSRIAESGTPQTEEFKPVTILFADIVASTELVSSLDPEEAMRRLAPAISLMRSSVEQFGGTVIHSLGDGIMALFGAPSIQEGHALLACRAALAIQSDIANTLGASAIRLGLHSGTIVSETKMSGNVKEREAYGVAIHIASRIQSLAEPGTIYLSENCYQLVQRYCSARFVGQRAIRGIPYEVNVYELQSADPPLSGQIFKGTALTIFQSREREMAVLESGLQAARRGASRIIGICGAAGSGKSRLCYEFAERCRRELIPVTEVRTQPYGNAAPLQPILEITRTLLGLLPGDDPAKARDQIANRLAQMETPSEGAVSILYDFLGLAEGSVASAVTPKMRHAILLDVISRLLGERASNPLVLIFEDLHWLDEASEAFLEVLCNAAAGTHIFMLVNFRPSYTAEWMHRTEFDRLDLSDLSSDQMERLVACIVGDHSDLAELRKRIAERSGGNPFFAEEIVHSLVESRVLFGRPGDYHLAREIDDDPLPVTLQAVIGERIDRLLPLDRALLQMASIIGKEVPYSVLANVSREEGILEIEPALERLCAVDLLQLQPGYDGRYYMFRHPLIQEVAYSGQLKSRRSSLHALVAPSLAAYFGERQDEIAGLLSFHYEAAGMFPQAAEYARRAAEWIGSMHPAQAIKQWQVVHRLVQSHRRSQKNDALLILASAQIAWLGWREGMGVKDAAPYIQEALSLAKNTDDTMVPLLLFVEARINGASGGAADGYVARVRDALKILERNADQSRAATLYASLSQAYGWAGLFHEALEANDRAMALLPHVQDFENRFLGYSVEHWTFSLRARILIHLNRIDEGRQWLEHMLAIEDGLIDPTVQFISHLGFVDLAWITRDADLAIKHASHVKALSERHGTPYLKVFDYACTAMALSLSGDCPSAIRELEEGIDFMHAARAALDYEPDMMASLSECLAQEGRYGEAFLAAERTITLSQERSSRLPECRALIVAGTSLFEQFGSQRIQEAEIFFTKAEALIRLTGATILESRLKAGRQKVVSSEHCH